MKPQKFDLAEVTKTSEACPNCKTAQLSLRPACCSDKEQGATVMKHCEKCGYKERLL